MLDDLDIGYCAVCESEYGSSDCYGCPLYEGPLDEDDEDDC